MSAGIEIRRALPADAPALSAIGTASFRDAYEGTADAADLEAHLAGYFAPGAVAAELAAGRVYLLASADGAAAGFVKLRECAAPLDVPLARPVELQQVYVAPGRQRLGLGGRLIAAAADHARALGADGLWLSVWEAAPWAINAYHKHGFERGGTLDFRLGAAVFTDYLMWRRI